MQPKQVRSARVRGDISELKRLGTIGGIRSGESRRYEVEKKSFLEDIDDAKLANEELARMLQAGEITQAEHDEQYRHIV